MGRDRHPLLTERFELVALSDGAIEIRLMHQLRPTGLFAGRAALQNTGG